MEIIINEKNKHKRSKLKWLILLLNILSSVINYKEKFIIDNKLLKNILNYKLVLYLLLHG